MVADREDLQRLAHRPVDVVDHPQEDALQRARPVRECGGRLLQLPAQRGERRLPGAGAGGAGGGGGRAGGGGPAHDRVAIVSRPPSRNSGQAPPSSLPRGSTTPCRYLLKMARSSGRAGPVIRRARRRGSGRSACAHRRSCCAGRRPPAHRSAPPSTATTPASRRRCPRRRPRPADRRSSGAARRAGSAERPGRSRGGAAVPRCGTGRSPPRSSCWSRPGCARS